MSTPPSTLNERLIVGARDTKLGPEEITRDIPNVGEEALKHLAPGWGDPGGCGSETGRHSGWQDHTQK